MIEALLQSLYDTRWATAIRESEVVFPALETVHILALALMVGTIAIVDLRLLGWLYADVPAQDVEKRIVPATWIGFILLAITGSLLFSANAIKLQHNLAFLTKLVLLLLTGINMLIFHYRNRDALRHNGSGARASRAARVGAVASLLLWTGVVATGRAIAYY